MSDNDNATASTPPQGDPSRGIVPGGTCVPAARRQSGAAVKYRRHRCDRRHRNFRALARCIWPRAAWIAGNGPFATVSRCPHGPSQRSMVTAVLHTTVEAARDSLAAIDGGGCGGQCTRQHKLVELVIE